MIEFDQQVQYLIFDRASQNISKRLPKTISFSNDINEQARTDIEKLKEERKIDWDFIFKLDSPFMEWVSNQQHPITAVIYYGEESERFCIGYMLGSVNFDKAAIELNYIAKRHDAHNDLKYQFFPSTLEILFTYAQ